MSDQIEQLVFRARQLAAIGQLQAAREHWLAVLNLLPANAAERQGVLREVERIDERLSPKPKPDWVKRLGPLGVVIAFLAKFKTVALLLLGKGKFLISIFAFVGFYWMLGGWWFGVGLAGSVLLHEMGHYVMVRRFGFQAELPMFIPGFGAFVKWNGANVDPSVRAQISLAGPCFGFFSGLLAYAIFLGTHQPIWLGIAHIAGLLNLVNLIPISIFDGSSAMAALGRQHRLALLVVCVALGFLLGEYAFFFVALGTGYRLWKRDFPAEPKQGIAYYFLALTVANGFLSWFCMNQARVLFAQMQ